jgi:hypothetical protein
MTTKTIRVNIVELNEFINVYEKRHPELKNLITPRLAVSIAISHALSKDITLKIKKGKIYIK